MGGPDFYRRLRELCGQRTSPIFTRLVAIMPDPAKRGELVGIYERVAKTSRQ
jgi:hypothetical protein